MAGMFPFFKQSSFPSFSFLSGIREPLWSLKPSRSSRTPLKLFDRHRIHPQAEDRAGDHGRLPLEEAAPAIADWPSP